MREAEYRVRHHAFEPERIWHVGPDGLSWQVGEKSGHFGFSEIVAIRLGYTPTRFDFARYRCIVTRFNGWEETIVSTSYRGIGSFEDRAGDYGRFIRTLIAEASRANPAIQFKAGESQLKYWGSIAILVAAFALLAIVVLSIGFNTTWLIIAKLLVIAFLFPVCLRWIAKNRPQPFSADAIPASVLPEESSDHRQ